MLYSGKPLITLLALVALGVVLAGCTSPTTTPAATATPSPAPTAAPTAGPSATPVATATPEPVPQSASVNIQNFAFSPQVVKIAAGGSVTWTNNDGTTHTVTFSDGSQTLSNGGTFTKAFPAAGSYQYHCSIHPSMMGTVEVV